MVDFKESFSNVLSNGQLTDFVFSITHGVANSLSKLSTSLSDSISTITIDEDSQSTRDYIRSIYYNGSGHHGSVSAAGASGTAGGNGVGVVEHVLGYISSF